MKNKKLTMGVVILAIILVLGVAYAAISNITLNITGNAAATASDINFNSSKFGFCQSATDTTLATTTNNATYTGGISPTGTITAVATNSTTAVVTVTGISNVGDVAKIKLYVANISDLYANVTPIVNASSASHFEVSIEPSTVTKLAPSTTTAYAYEVSVKLKNPVAVDMVDAESFTITLDAAASES